MAQLLLPGPAWTPLALPHLGVRSAGGLVQTGSHTDAIPLAGAYDGTLGVLGGIAALRALRAAGFRPQRGIEVIMFTSEEPTRFALGCSGRLAAWAPAPALLAARKAPQGIPPELKAA